MYALPNISGTPLLIIHRHQARSIVVIWVKVLMSKIYSKSLVRAIDKVLLMKLRDFWWSALITLDNNNDVLADF